MRFLFFILFLLFVVPSAQAIGFSNPPSVREFLFTPNAEFSIPLYVSNAELIAVNLNFPTPGDPSTIGTAEDDNIAEYVTIYDPAPFTGPREVEFLFDLPNQMKPGVYDIDLHITEHKEVAETEMFSARASAKFRLKLRVLSPEKLIEVTRFAVTPSAEGLRTNATIHVVSRTTQDISLLVAEFEIRDGERVVGSGESDRQQLASGETTVLVGELSSENLIGGEYEVYAQVFFDTGIVPAGPSILKIGSLHVDLVNYTPTMLYNETNKFTFTIANQWNQELQDVFAFVSLGEQNKKTASLTVPPFGLQTYEIYFDRDPALLLGQAEANITVSFKDYVPADNIYIQKEESFLRMIDVTQPVEEHQPMKLSSIMLVGSVILLVVALLFFFFFRKRKKPEEAPPEMPQQPSTPQQDIPQKEFSEQR